MREECFGLHVGGDMAGVLVHVFASFLMRWLGVVRPHEPPHGILT